MAMKGNKILIISLLSSVLLVSYLGFGTWSKNNEADLNYYANYLTRQSEILKYLQQAIDAKNNRSDLIGFLNLAKGEFAGLDRIINNVKLPDSLRLFHERGKILIDDIFVNAAKGKSIATKIDELERYTAKLRQMVHGLTPIIAEDKTTGKEIYQDLENLSRKIQLGN